MAAFLLLALSLASLMVVVIIYYCKLENEANFSASFNKP